jgi:hypothetical protein
MPQPQRDIFNPYKERIDIMQSRKQETKAPAILQTEEPVKEIKAEEKKAPEVKAEVPPVEEFVLPPTETNDDISILTDDIPEDVKNLDALSDDAEMFVVNPKNKKIKLELVDRAYRIFEELRDNPSLYYPNRKDRESMRPKVAFEQMTQANLQNWIKKNEAKIMKSFQDPRQTQLDRFYSVQLPQKKSPLKQTPLKQTLLRPLNEATASTLVN